MRFTNKNISSKYNYKYLFISLAKTDHIAHILPVLISLLMPEILFDILHSEEKQSCRQESN